MNFHRIFHWFTGCYHDDGIIKLTGRCNREDIDWHIKTCCLCDHEKLAKSVYIWWED